MRSRGMLLRGLAVALLGLAATAISAPIEAEGASFACTVCGFHSTCDDAMCSWNCPGEPCEGSCERNSQDCDGMAKYTCAVC
jgi:hypothetical protein